MRTRLLQQLNALGTHAAPYDLAVVGGGATGLGVALDAALRGYSVVLFDSHDFASGTSSRSTKLLHGGVRYLAQGNVSLVREALAERATVLKLAPHLAQPLPFVMPSYHWWQTPFYGIGLKLYDLLAGRAGLHHTEWLGRDATLAALPGVNAHGLQGGVKYWDGQFDDARLALALARSVEAAGGLPLNYMSVEALQPLPQNEQQDGARFVLTVRDKLAPPESAGAQHPASLLQVRARAVVNATGVWVDKLRNQARESQPTVSAAPTSSQASSQASPSSMVSPSQGVHVVVDRSFLPGDHALLVPKTQDGRVLFAVPWLGSLILGTTDTPRPDAPREPEPFEAELDFILQEASRVLSRPVQRQDIRSMWVGLRPLVSAPSAAQGNAGQAGHTRGLSREHTIVTDPSGLLTVTGGKWTTYRAMAEDVLNTCFASGLLQARGKPSTALHLLVGAPRTLPGQPAQPALHAAPGLHLFGSEQDAVMALPGAHTELGLGLTEAMVRYAVRHEYACTVEDVLARRWRALFLDAQQAMAMAPAVAALLQEEHGQDPQLEAFTRMAQRYLPA
jgi:glycerol-3-phosphate dehydrogenase